MSKNLSFKKNTFWLILAHSYTMIISLIVGPLTARSLGPEMYGILAYGESIVAILLIFSQLGIGGIAVAEYVKKENRLDETIGSILGLRIISSLISCAVVIVLIFFLRPDNKLIQLVVLLQSSTIVFQIFEVFEFWFQAEYLSKYIAFVFIFSYTIMSAFKIYLAFVNPNIYLFAIANSMRYAINLLLFFYIFKKINRELKFKFIFAKAKFILKRSYHFLLASIGVLIYYQVDKIMVEHMLGPTGLGYYSVAVLLISMWQFIPLSISKSAAPAIFKAKEIDESIYLKKYQLLLLGNTILSIFVCIAVMLLGKFVIVFLYGNAYEPSVPLFIILMWSSLFAILDFSRNNWLISEGYERYAKILSYIGAFSDILLNYLLIPVYGLEGAAFATLLTQIIIFFGTPIIFKEIRRSNRIYFSSFVYFPDLYQVCLLKLRNMLKRR